MCMVVVLSGSGYDRQYIKVPGCPLREGIQGI